MHLHVIVENKITAQERILTIANNKFTIVENNISLAISLSVSFQQFRKALQLIPRTFFDVQNNDSGDHFTPAYH
jgi:hypothetical protein